MALTHRAKHIGNEPIRYSNRLKLESMYSLVPIVNDSLHISWFGDRSYGTINKAKTVV